MKIYIVIQPWDYASAEAFAFPDEQSARDYLDKLRRNSRDGFYASITEQEIFYQINQPNQPSLGTKTQNL